MKDALISPSSCKTWHSDKPLQKQSFRGFMRDICKSAKCQITYTPHCLRATAIYSKYDAGFQARHIMFMSGHRCDASLKTYNRNMSVDQKRKASSVLATIGNPDYENTNKSDASYNISLPLVSMPVSPEIPLHASPTVDDNATSSSSTQMDIHTQSNITSLRRMAAEILSRSTFHNCTFNLNSNF